MPDPFLGPKGIRLLLVFRGFSGCVESISPTHHLGPDANRFFGLFGVYYSLQYLSLSDATVLTFLAPMCTAVAGAIFLKERLTRQHILAGSARRSCCLFRVLIETAVISLVGVVLIARPTSLFGDTQVKLPIAVPDDGGFPTPHGPRIATPAQRLSAVG